MEHLENDLGMQDNLQGNWLSIRWHIDDVLSIRPDLTNDQARQVLLSLKHGHDANIGINWEVIEIVADYEFPRKEWKDQDLYAMANS